METLTELGKLLGHTPSSMITIALPSKYRL